MKRIYLDILQIEESKHKDFAEFIGRIFMFHAAAQPVRAVPSKKNGLAASDAKVPGGWRLFTQKHPSFVSFITQWVFVFGVFSTWRASKIPFLSLYKIIFKGFCWPKFKTSPNAFISTIIFSSVGDVCTFGMSIFNIKDSEYGGIMFVLFVMDFFVLKNLLSHHSDVFLMEIS